MKNNISVYEHGKNIAKIPEGKKVVIVLNDRSDKQEFNIRYHDRLLRTSLDGGDVATIIW